MKSLNSDVAHPPVAVDLAVPVMAATAHSLPEQVHALGRARAFAEPLLASEYLDTGENVLSHADAVAAILNDIGGSEAMQAASYLVYACDHLNKPQETITKAFGSNFAALAMETTKLVRVQQHARQSRLARQPATPDALVSSQAEGIQTENVRKMLLAFSRDLRVVMLRLASRLQTLRFFAASKLPVPQGIASESLQVFAPLANRLGIWEIKWEMEDLAFRFLEPDTYRQVARLLDEKRVEREVHVERMRSQLEQDLNANGISAKVSGRPKHIYSIVKKMRGKSLGFDQVYDIRALRIVVTNVPECYAALSWVHSHFSPIAQEFDDYIAKPKVNGYQSLHTVVRTEVGQIFEIQIRTDAMHAYAEQGTAAHWAYKEAGTRGYQGQAQAGDYQARIALARQLLALQQELASSQVDAPESQAISAEPERNADADDRIFVLTPQARIVELAPGSTAVDFAYALHTDLGHRCRGARVDGVLMPLTTPLRSGQTVEIVAAKEGGPSRDWLNPELGYLRSPRARAKVRAWFNQIAQEQTISKGRAQVERLLQREGRTSINLQTLAEGLGFRTAEELFERVGKDEFSQRQIEAYLRGDQNAAEQDNTLQAFPAQAARAGQHGGQVLVVGMGSLLTQLAPCCKPAPPDAIGGFVTRERGVSVHRANCPNYLNIATQHPERVIAVAWGGPGAHESLYPIDLEVSANDRQGLLRDISEVLAKEKINVIAVSTRSVRDLAQMRFTVQLPDSSRLKRALVLIAEVSGVIKAGRK
ncbi:GTP pyrophosphokinase [mine drainage metagenome]|uniref:GTP pyrophosphokinase n=1 Tax=mine drainage metagenome TaxID=410659 RepID=A0A1J5QGN5_9ZZZZ